MLSGVRYATKMTDDEIKSLLRWAYARWKRGGGGDNKEGMVANLMTYKGMAAAARVLCRWPRPSELARIVAAADMPPMEYTRMTVTFEAKIPIGKLIGPKGQHLINLTHNHRLLYAWVKKLDGRGAIYELTVYSINDPVPAGQRAKAVPNMNTKCTLAIEDFLKNNGVVEKSRRMRTMKFTAKTSFVGWDT